MQHLKLQKHGTITSEMLNKEYGDKGRTFEAFDSAERFLKNSKRRGFIYKLVDYRAGDLMADWMDTGKKQRIFEGIKELRPPREIGWLITFED